jgi:hypothetical protein
LGTRPEFAWLPVVVLVSPEERCKSTGSRSGRWRSHPELQHLGEVVSRVRAALTSKEQIVRRSRREPQLVANRKLRSQSAASAAVRSGSGNGLASGAQRPDDFLTRSGGEEFAVMVPRNRFRWRAPSAVAERLWREIQNLGIARPAPPQGKSVAINKGVALPDAGKLADSELR